MPSHPNPSAAGSRRHPRLLPLVMLTLAFLVFQPAPARSCQIEYSDWLIRAFRSQGMSLDKRVGNFSNLAECQAALRQAVAQSGDPSLANNMRCVNCGNGPSSSAPQRPAPTTGARNRRLRGTAPAPAPSPGDGQAQRDFEAGKNQLLRGLKGGGSDTGLALKGSGAASPQLALKTGRKPAADPVVRQEQDDFDRMQAQWLRNQQELIRQSVAHNRKWRNEALDSIQRTKVPNPAARPQAMDDLQPGDVLLIGPDDSLIAGAIKKADPLYRALDYFAAGRVSAPKAEQGKATHVLTFVKKVKGKMLFLDHTLEGSRILDEEALTQKYGNRSLYIAKPQAKIDGRKLWEAAREAALKKKSDYGLVGASVVCSERAAIAVAKASDLKMDKEQHGFGLGPVDITPSDFFDEKHVGKFFLISTQPIMLHR
ncbi:MAG: hypothetical protein JXB25_04170 [Deltaproteobacteria bacterium]|nr:hypothetical protein [Deltaproteobacteria bacterium]